MVSVTISIVRNGRQLVPINIIGMVVCMGGIAAHVARKSMQPIEERNKHTKKLGEKKKYSVLDQSSSDSYSDEECFFDLTRPNSGVNKHRASSDKCDTQTAQPLLWNENESELSSDEEAFHLNNMNKSGDNTAMHNKRLGDKSWNSVGDDFFLRENRTWTSVRDAHVKMLYDTSSKEENNIDVHNDEILINTNES